MKQLQQLFSILTRKDRALWVGSCVMVCVAFCLGGTFQPLLLFTSLLGVTALIFMAKGHVMGQLLTVAFSLLYGIISYRTAYYGEMITYLGMTMPMAALAAWAWFRNPFAEQGQEVAVAKLTRTHIVQMAVLTTLVTIAFYFILAFFGTRYLPLSTLSIATSFSASFLTYRRSHLYAIAYALNDIVLIVLWSLATMEEAGYLTIVLCFTMFLLNDLYAYVSWKQMKHRQEQVLDKINP